MATLAAPSYQTLYSTSSTWMPHEAFLPSLYLPQSSYSSHMPSSQSRSRVLSSRRTNQYPPGLGFDVGNRGRKTAKKSTSPNSGYRAPRPSRIGSSVIAYDPLKKTFDPFSPSLDDPTYPYGDSEETKTPLVYTHTPSQPYIIQIPPAAPPHSPDPSLSAPSRPASPPSPVSSRTTPMPEIRKPTPIPVRNPNARVIASILLNRIYAVGRPRRAGSGADRARYVKSGLSEVVFLNP